MPLKVIPQGAVVVGECSKKIKGICSYPAGVGSLLIYRDEQGGQINVCKRCSDYLLSIGEWFVNYNPERALGSAEKRFRNYIIRMKKETDIDTKISIAKEYIGQEWPIRVPIVAGLYKNGYWTIDLSIDDLGEVRISFREEDEGAPSVVVVRPVTNKEEFEASNNAIFIVDRKVRSI